MPRTSRRLDAPDPTDVNPSQGTLRIVFASALIAIVLLATSLTLATFKPDSEMLAEALQVAALIALLAVLGALPALRRAGTRDAVSPAGNASTTPLAGSNGDSRMIGPLSESQPTPELTSDAMRNLAGATGDLATLLRDMINQIPYPLFAQNDAGQVLFVNRALAALYGTTPAKLVQPENSSHLRKISSEDLLTRPSGSHNGEEWLTTIDGEERRYLVQRLPFDSIVQGELVVAIEVTELHRLQLQLQFSQRLEVLGTLAGGIAHDFNNLLTPILGYSSMLLEEPLADAQRSKIEAIATSANRARAVAQQMLSFSRQSDDLTTREQIDLVPVIEEAVAFMRASVPPNVNIRVDLQQMPPIDADAGQLHQVLVNLCMNAVQSITRPSGEVLVSCSTVPAGAAELPPSLQDVDHALIRVDDNGVGMSDAVMGHVFEPFFTTKEVGEGSGLGLSTAKSIVGRHQGEITVTSSEQAGSCFSVYLPLATPRHMGQPRSNSDASVLLVDDDAMVLQVLEDLLRTQGFKVTACAEPKSAIDTLADASVAIDVLITDNNMPRMKGVELARRARALRPQLPVILITGFARPSAAELANVSRSLHKPVAAKDLATAIRELTSAHQAA